MTDDRPFLWILDSEPGLLAECLGAFDDWADVHYINPEEETLRWEEPPDAVLFSAEILGGATGEAFAALARDAGDVPLLAVARLRSLTQALAYFRSGAADYLPLPLDGEETRERLAAALARAERLAMQAVMVELERVDEDTGEISLTLREKTADAAAEDEDILAGIATVPPASIKASRPVAASPETATEASPDASAERPEPETEDAAVVHEDEPEPVDGLPIPTLWEELPCGLLVFDSRVNLVFANANALELFGRQTLAELQDVLENRRSVFAAHSLNGRPLPDNQWPHALAVKSRAARAATISVEKADKSRLWLRIDCLPHLSEGAVSRLSMTVVNLTGDLPPFSAPAAPKQPAPAREKQKARGRRKR